MSAMQFEGIKVALKQDATGYVLTIKIHPDEIPEELLRDFVGARYGVAMVRINDDETPVPVSNRVQKAGILCRDRLFHAYLNEIHGIAKSEPEAIKFLYGYCGIETRAALNGLKSAQDSFDELLQEYNQWRKKDEPF
jgi:hypothetical protein